MSLIEQKEIEILSNIINKKENAKSVFLNYLSNLSEEKINIETNLKFITNIIQFKKAELNLDIINKKDIVTNPDYPVSVLEDINLREYLILFTKMNTENIKAITDNINNTPISNKTILSLENIKALTPQIIDLIKKANDFNITLFNNEISEKIINLMDISYVLDMDNSSEQDVFNFYENLKVLCDNNLEINVINYHSDPLFIKLINGLKINQEYLDDFEKRYEHKINYEECQHFILKTFFKYSEYILVEMKLMNEVIEDSFNIKNKNLSDEINGKIFINNVNKINEYYDRHKNIEIFQKASLPFVAMIEKKILNDNIKNDLAISTAKPKRL
ncbi:TPA: hypothetical protein NV714_002693 [Escherichia coli]|nr:hypothetical protein [Escherichia coli]